MPGTLDSLELVSLSALPADERARLLDRYDREVYRPAFPDHELREDPALWRTLLGADPYPLPPQPLIDVLLLRGEEEAILGGATIEYYRTACSGLLTYVAVAAH